MKYLPFLLAKKFYYSKQENSLGILISILSKIGISISIFVLLVSCSILNGFQIQLNKKILSSLPHGIISLKNPSEQQWKFIKHNIENIPEILHVERYVLMDGLLENKNAIKLVQIKGLDNIKYLKKNFFLNDITKNIFQEKKNIIIISSDIANFLCLKKNDWINLIIPDKKNSFMKFGTKYFSMQIKEIFKSKGYLDSDVAFISLNFLKKYFYLENTVSQIELKILNPFHIDHVMMHAVKKINSPVLIDTWMKTYKQIYNDMQMIKAIVYLSISLVILISCFSISSVSFILISQKTKDICILRSIGANNFFIQRVLFYYGLRFIITGILIGLFLGIITILNFKKIILFIGEILHNNILIENVYIKDFLLLKLNISDVIIILIITIIISIITNLYPAYYASTINPIQILKEK